jgi:hypothetical protein
MASLASYFLVHDSFTTSPPRSSSIYETSTLKVVLQYYEMPTRVNPFYN